MMTLPLNQPNIPKGGTNYEGLTWIEWCNAARFGQGGRGPRNMTEEVEWSSAWRCGVDPTEMWAW